MENISKRQILICILFLFVASICSYLYLKDLKANTIILQKYHLIISDKNLQSIEIDNKEITDKSTIQKIRTLISNRTTAIASISDYPVNATNILNLKFTYSNEVTKSLTIYQKGRNYFIEEPYNGIYKLKKEDYQKIENFKNKQDN